MPKDKELEEKVCEISTTGKLTLSKEITITDDEGVSKKVKSIKVLKEDEVVGAELFAHVETESKNQIGVLGYLTGLSTAELYQLNAKDYAKLMTYMGKLMS